MSELLGPDAEIAECTRCHAPTPQTKYTQTIDGLRCFYCRKHGQPKNRPDEPCIPCQFSGNPLREDIPLAANCSSHESYWPDPLGVK